MRQDKYADAYRVVPEVEKEAANQGKYIHATEWGQPQAKEINFEINTADQLTITEKTEVKRNRIVARTIIFWICLIALIEYIKSW